VAAEQSPPCSLQQNRLHWSKSPPCERQTAPDSWKTHEGNANRKCCGSLNDALSYCCSRSAAAKPCLTPDSILHQIWGLQKHTNVGIISSILLFISNLKKKNGENRSLAELCPVLGIAAACRAAMHRTQQRNLVTNG
jgi:hypothetical protein